MIIRTQIEGVANARDSARSVETNLPIMRLRQWARLAAGVLAAILFAGTHTPGAAQEANAPDSQEIERKFVEYQRIHVALEDLQQRAMRDPEVRAVQEDLDSILDAEINRIDPRMPQRLARAAVLEAEAHAAQQSGDDARADDLVAELATIRDAITAAQQQVLADPELARRITEYQQQLQRKMFDIDPDLPNLLVRFRELESDLRGASVELPG